MAEDAIRRLPAPLLHALILGNADAVARHWSAEGAGALVETMAPVLAEAAWMAIRGRTEQTRGEVSAAPAKQSLASAEGNYSRAAAHTGPVRGERHRWIAIQATMKLEATPSQSGAAPMVPALW